VRACVYISYHIRVRVTYMFLTDSSLMGRILSDVDEFRVMIVIGRNCDTVGLVPTPSNHY